MPGGTVSPGEDLFTAILREILEETSINDLNFVQKLGDVRRDVREFGSNTHHERHYFHFELEEEPLESWIHAEETPADGSPGLIAFRFYWVELEYVPRLAGGLDELLSKVT